MNESLKLSRHLGFFTLAIYGIGDILGAGIYALVGKVAGVAGQGAWISFLIAAVLAAITGLSYAELCSRVPHSAGAAAFSARAFKQPLIPFLVGIFVLGSGITSAATVSLALYGYLSVFFNISQVLAACLFIVMVSFISFWGIRESARANNVMTLIEVLGLLAVIAAGLYYVMKNTEIELAAQLIPDMGMNAILIGASLAFYAFLGFEDLANLAEEAKNPSRDLPRAILVAVAVSSTLYLMVMCIVIWTMTPEQAGSSATPLLDVLNIAGMGAPAWIFALVALIAICNTGLANLVMGSRLLYGMSTEGLLPKIVQTIHPLRRTPWIAVLICMLLCLLLVLTGSVSLMAQTSSLLIMTVFSFLHLSLILIRKKNIGTKNVFSVPRLVPYIGIFLCIFMITSINLEAFMRAGIVLIVGLILYFIVVRKAS